MGKHYIIEHAMAYCKRRQRDESFRTYIADALNALTHNTSRSGESIVMSMRYDDMLKPQKKEDDDEPMSAEETITHFKDKMRGFEKGGNSDGMDDTGCQADSR